MQKQAIPNMSIKSNASEWDKLQLEELRTNNELRKQQVKEFGNKAVCDRIEQARRNVEVLSRIYFSFFEKNKHEKSEEILKVMDNNVKILEEVNRIK